MAAEEPYAEELSGVTCEFQTIGPYGNEMSEAVAKGQHIYGRIRGIRRCYGYVGYLQLINLFEGW